MNIRGFNAESSLYETRGQYSLRSTVGFIGYANTLVYPFQLARRLGGFGGGGLPVKCESDQGDVCTCGPGKCCVTVPNGCVCEPYPGPTGPTQPPVVLARLGTAFRKPREAAGLVVHDLPR